MRSSNRQRVWFVLCLFVGTAAAQSKLNRFNFTAGGGLGVGRDDVAAFVGNSPHAVVGAGMNFSRMFGFDAEYMYYDLGFRPSVIVGQSLPGQSGHMHSISLDGIVNVPRNYNNLGAYGIFGMGFYDRTVSINPSRPLEGGTSYQPAWLWWDVKRDISGNVVAGQIMGSNSRIAGGFNYGGGLTYRLKYVDHAKLFLEFRYHRAYQRDGKTIVVPITLGLRW